MVQIISRIQKLWQNRRWADGLRVEYFPRIQYVAPQWRSQKFTEQIGRNTRKCHRKNSFHVDVQRHFLWNKRQWTRMSGKRTTRIFVCKKIWKRTMVISLVLVLRKSGILSKRTVHKESGTKLKKGCCRNSLRADVQFSVPRLHCPEENSKAKDMVNCRFTLQPSGNDWYYFSHNCFCKPAQSLRSSRGDVWRIWNPSRQIGATWCDGAINRAQCDQDRSFFGEWWPSISKFSIAIKWRTNWEAVSTRQIEKNLYGCRISECCWEWTVFHDERHWRFYTIQYSGLSWIHSSEREDSTSQPKGWDPCWKLQPVTFTVNMEVRSELFLE